MKHDGVCTEFCFDNPERFEWEVCVKYGTVMDLMQPVDYLWVVFNVTEIWKTKILRLWNSTSSTQKFMYKVLIHGFVVLNHDEFHGLMVLIFRVTSISSFLLLLVIDTYSSIESFGSVRVNNEGRDYTHSWFCMRGQQFFKPIHPWCY